MMLKNIWDDWWVKLSKGEIPTKVNHGQAIIVLIIIPNMKAWVKPIPAAWRIPVITAAIPASRTVDRYVIETKLFIT